MTGKCREISYELLWKNDRLWMEMRPDRGSGPVRTTDLSDSQFGKLVLGSRYVGNIGAACGSSLLSLSWAGVHLLSAPPYFEPMSVGIDVAFTGELKHDLGPRRERVDHFAESRR